MTSVERRGEIAFDDESAAGGVLGATTVFTVLDVIIGSVTFTGSLIAARFMQSILILPPSVISAIGLPRNNSTTYIPS